MKYEVVALKDENTAYAEKFAVHEDVIVELRDEIEELKDVIRGLKAIIRNERRQDITL